MSDRAKRARNKKLGPFVPLENEFRATRAWKALSYGARCLYIELKGFYSHKHQNNVFVSVRDAMTALGRASTHCQYFFHELEHYGFIVKMTEGCLGPDGVGVAPHWRLTELCNVNHPGPPTRDYMEWNGVRFRPPRKTESRAVLPHRVCRSTAHTGNEKEPVLAREVCRSTAHSQDGDCAVLPHISRYTTPQRQRRRARVTTRSVGRDSTDKIDVVRDGDRCYGYIRQRDKIWLGTCSDSGRDYHIGKFQSKALAVAAVVNRATGKPLKLDPNCAGCIPDEVSTKIAPRRQ